MGMLYEPVVHRCSTPATFGVPYELGAWWKCDECGGLWEYAALAYRNGWKRRRPTKRVLRKIARLTSEEQR